MEATCSQLQGVSVSVADVKWIQDRYNLLWARELLPQDTVIEQI